MPLIPNVTWSTRYVVACLLTAAAIFDGSTSEGSYTTRAFSVARLTGASITLAISRWHPRRYQRRMRRSSR